MWFIFSAANPSENEHSALQFFIVFFLARLIYCLHWMTLNNFLNRNIKATNKEPK